MTPRRVMQECSASMTTPTPCGRFQQTLAVGIVAGPLDQGADGLFGLGLGNRSVGHVPILVRHASGGEGGSGLGGILINAHLESLQAVELQLGPDPGDQLRFDDLAVDVVVEVEQPDFQ